MDSGSLVEVCGILWRRGGMADAVSSSLTGEIRAGSSPAVANNQLCGPVAELA